MSQIIPEVIQDGRRQEEPEGIIGTVVNTILNTVIESNKEVVTILRVPTPIKVSQVFTVNAAGQIGGGLAVPNPETIYECPMSAEAWIHRVTVYSPEHPPANPLSTGQIVCSGSTAGEIIFFLPQEPGTVSNLVAPAQPVIEGRSSAPHLNPGERMLLAGDTLPAGNHIRIDVQLILVMGVSAYTPRQTAPTNLNAMADGNIT